MCKSLNGEFNPDARARRELNLMTRLMKQNQKRFDA